MLIFAGVFENIYDMRKIFALTAVIFTLAAADCAAAAGKKTTIWTDASDSRITYAGRVLRDGADVSFDWSGVQCRVKFTGQSIALRCSDTKANYYNVWFDKGTEETPDLVIRTAGRDTTIVLAEKLGRGAHCMTLLKRTEGEQGRTTFHAFGTTGELLQAEPLRGRYIEFIGDSYTCGYGTENSKRDDPFKAETENCNLTYAAVISRYFNADYNLVSHSGRGIARNYDDWGKDIPGTTMPEKYDRLFDESAEPACPPAERIPDLVVIYLGANDFSTGKQPSMDAFCGNYIKLLGEIRERYGEDVPILCLAARLDPGIYVYVREACRRSGMEKIRSVALQDGVHDEDGDLGASSHPNYSGHKKMASVIIPYVSTITGWAMEEKAVR